MIQTEGKLAFCKLFLEDLKELKRQTWSPQNRKKMLTKEMKQYCLHRNLAKDRKFLASLDKLIRKEKKKMDKKYAKNNYYLKLDMDDKLYNRLNDTDFLMSVKGFLSNIQKNPNNDDDSDDDNVDDANDDNTNDTNDINADDADHNNFADANNDNVDDAIDSNANDTEYNNGDDADHDKADNDEVYEE